MGLFTAYVLGHRRMRPVGWEKLTDDQRRKARNKIKKARQTLRDLRRAQ